MVGVLMNKADLPELTRALNRLYRALVIISDIEGTSDIEDFISDAAALLEDKITELESDGE
jgi:hypothetical protein